MTELMTGWHITYEGTPLWHRYACQTDYRKITHWLDGVPGLPETKEES